MAEPAGWPGFVLAVVGALGVREMASRILTLRQERRKGDAEARAVNVATDGGLFDRAERQMDRLERQVSQLEARNCELADRLNEMAERCRLQDDRIAELRRRVRELGGELPTAG